MAANSASPHQLASWIQLGIFTAFLFLLVAIPYTIFLKASLPKTPLYVANITHITPRPPMPTITPPPSSTTTACIPVPDTYKYDVSTPSAYLFPGRQKTLCFPPALPPFPFIWQPYTSYQYGYTIDTPSNWVDKSTTLRSTTIHIFASEEIGTSSALPAVSFAWYQGADPYATQSSFLKEQITRDGKTGTLYTGQNGYIAVIFPDAKGYLRLEGSQLDSAFFAFQHMLDSILWNR